MSLKFKKFMGIPRFLELFFLTFIAVIICLYQPRIGLAIDHPHLIDPNNSFILNEQEKQMIQSLSPLRVMIDDNFAPLSSFDTKTGSFNGLSVDLFRHVAGKLGLKFQLLHDAKLSWSDKVELFKKQKIDLLMPTSYTEERAGYGIFTNSFYETYYAAIIKTTSNIRINSSPDLARYRIGVTKASAIIPYIQSSIPGAQLKYYENQKGLYQGVRSGDVDIALQNSNVFNDDRFNLGFVDLKISHAITEYPRKYAYFLNKTEPYQELAAIIDRYLAGADYSRLISEFERSEDELILRYTEQKHHKKLLLFGITGTLVLLSLLGVAFLSRRRFTARLATTLEHVQQQRMLLLASEARYRRITEGLTDYQYTVRINNGRAVEVTQSPACEKVTGYTPEEFASDPYLWIQMVAPDDRELVGNRVNQLLDGMDILPVEHRIIRKDGEMRWVIDTTILYRDASGELVSYDGVIKDITETKRAEEALLALKDKLQKQNDTLQLTEESLREQNDLLLATEEMLREQIEEYEASQRLLKDSEERFKILSEASFGGIVIHDKGIILECNQVLSDMSGIPVEKLIGMNGFELISPVWHELLMHMKSGLDQRYEVEAIRADGTVFPVAVRGKTIPYKGRIVRVSEFRDITERKQAEEDRRQLEEQFQHAQKLESLGVLAGGIAHDFNNILTVIMGHCYLASEGLESDEEYKDTFQKVEAAGNRAADLCRQMLAYAGKSHMEKTQVNLRLLVDDVVKMLQAAIKKNVTIELGLDRYIPMIKGDSGQIQQIVMNLIINAAEAIDEANGTIRVVLTKKVFEADCAEYDALGFPIQDGSYICLEVTDTGCGMNEETQKRIFDPFFTTKFTGRGLGMSAICGIVKSHEGVLQLTSAPGAGTTFKVCFPISEVEECLESLPATAVHSRESSGTILIVEDEQALRDLGRELLEMIGFTALTAQHGQEALDIYHERGGEIEVILLDLVMSVMGGVELYHELRKIAPTLPIIFCSGYGVESVEWVINNDQYAEFVHKPYKPAELINLIMDMKTASPSFSD